MRIVGVIGEIGCGKSTFAKQLELGHRFQSMLFAEPLKRLCCEQFGWDFDQLDSQEYKNQPAYAPTPGNLSPPTRRAVLQHLGTEGFRTLDPDHWTKQADRAVKNLYRSTGQHDFVFGDLRFHNEADLIRSYGGQIIRVVRWGESRYASSHASEEEWRTIEPNRTFTCADGVRNVCNAADWLMNTWEHEQGSLEIFGEITPTPLSKTINDTPEGEPIDTQDFA